MTMPPERSRPLHNFSLPPVLKWGNQKLLRCSKIPTLTESINLRSPSSFLLHRSSAAHPIEATSKILFTDDGSGIGVVREKLTLDLRVAADNMKVSMMTEEGVVTEDDNSASAMRPWNLRTRRAACKAPPPIQSNGNARASGRLRGFGAGNNGVEKKENVKFSVSISKEEVEDDFLAMFGTRPPRRPKKRAKVVQKQLDSMFPGLWLTEVTPESYKVDDIPES